MKDRRKHQKTKISYVIFKLTKRLEKEKDHLITLDMSDNEQCIRDIENSQMQNAIVQNDIGTYLELEKERHECNENDH